MKSNVCRFRTAIYLRQACVILCTGHLILLGLKIRSLPIRGSVLTTSLQYVPNIRDNGVQLKQFRS